MAMASGHSCFPPFEDFLWYHCDYPKTFFPNQNSYCDKMMRYLGLYGKPKHIFIHAPRHEILNVCRGGGIYQGNGWYRSKGFFPITVCTFHPPHGPYTGKCLRAIIVLRCCHGFPVEIKE
ncbi:ribonuclease pancreatic-like [Pelodiscus sinensis]|uniref:ribonuclease pancreatic-like n=1 Tax=Pelodiscus sinensis TaxID=13735 RepID=UPI003F6D6F6B